MDVFDIGSLPTDNTRRFSGRAVQLIHTSHPTTRRPTYQQNIPGRVMGRQVSKYTRASEASSASTQLKKPTTS